MAGSKDLRGWFGGKNDLDSNWFFRFKQKFSIELEIFGANRAGLILTELFNQPEGFKLKFCLDQTKVFGVKQADLIRKILFQQNRPESKKIIFFPQIIL